MTTAQHNSFIRGRVVIQTDSNAHVLWGLKMKNKNGRKPKTPAAKKDYRSITFRPDEAMFAQIQRVISATKMKKSTIVQECVREHLPHLLATNLKKTAELVEEGPLVDNATPNSILGVMGAEKNPPLAGAGEQRAGVRPSIERNK